MTTAKYFFRQLFPVPRRPVHGKAVVTLIVFLVLYLVGCIYLEMSGKLLFANRLGFLLMLATPWIWWMHVAGRSGLTRFRGQLSLLVRLSLVGLFAMLMAEPRAVRTSDKLSVVYALDISDSIGEGSTDAALEFVSKTVSASA